MQYINLSSPSPLHWDLILYSVRLLIESYLWYHPREQVCPLKFGLDTKFRLFLLIFQLKYLNSKRHYIYYVMLDPEILTMYEISTNQI